MASAGHAGAPATPRRRRRRTPASPGWLSMMRIRAMARRSDPLLRVRHPLASRFGRKRVREIDMLNTAIKLQCREIGVRSRISLGLASNSPERFKNIQLQEEFDIYDSINLPLRLTFLKPRSKIVEITASRDILFVLSQCGLCAAFCRRTNRGICFLNTSADQVIRSIFYNKCNESLVTMSVYPLEKYKYLRCRSTQIEYIRRNQFDAGINLFETESLQWPGFVEFDDLNEKVLISDVVHCTYKVYGLKNYTLLYTMPHDNIQDIKISPGVLFIQQKKNRGSNALRMKLLSIEDGTELKSFSHLLHRKKRLEILELFNEKLLVKQMDENLEILDVTNLELLDVEHCKSTSPSAFIFLTDKQMFLAFWGSTVELWNFRGEVVTRFEDNELWYPDTGTNIVYVNNYQDLMISYCKGINLNQNQFPGSINVSDIHSGRSIAKVCPNDSNLKVSPRRSGDTNRTSVRSTIREALQQVTALYYDEDQHVLYTGNWEGLVHSWHS